MQDRAKLVRTNFAADVAEWAGVADRHGKGPGVAQALAGLVALAFPVGRVKLASANFSWLQVLGRVGIARAHQ